MVDSLFSLLSAFLGLVLLTSAVLVGAAACRNGRIGLLSLELRYVGALALFFLVTVIGNQWVSGSVLFPSLSVAAIATVAVSRKHLTPLDFRKVIVDGLSLLTVQAIVLALAFIAFQMHQYWLLEAANHDSLVYYQGGHWALESPLFVGSEAVRARWGLGACGEGAGWIGFDCPLYRGGTYTIAAWIQFFTFRDSGNGLYFVSAYAATMAWFAVRLLRESAVGLKAWWLNTLLALTVTLSTGTVGALVNSNLATVMGGGGLVMIVALALRSDIGPRIRYGLMACWCAISAHFYAESVFYAGLLVALLFLFELRLLARMINPLRIVKLATLLLFIVLVLGNIAVIQAISSLFFFGDIAQGGAWFSWYIHQQPFLWVGGFVAGILMGVEVAPQWVVVAAILTLSAFLYFLYLRETRSGTFALAGLSMLAVTYIEITGFQYGEHKILHLIGPAWALFIVAAISRMLSYMRVSLFPKYMVITVSIAAMGGVSCLLLLFMNFSYAAWNQLNNSRGPHGLDFGLSTLVSYVRPGDSVVLDDNAWVGVEKFQKAHYLIFQVHNQRAQLLMPSLADDSLRGGYFRNVVSDKLRELDDVDWLVKARGSKIQASKFISESQTPVWRNSDYALYAIANEPIAVMSDGWYNCQSEYCWTKAPFEIETFVPSGGDFELSLDFWTFMPPEDGTIKVHTSHGKLIATADANEKQLRINLPEGWSKLVFDCNWPVLAPAEVGLSPDTRRLFVAIKKIDITSLGPEEKD